jgi:ABC-type transport system involved in cytochrome c biogenesis permease subunit
MNISGESSRTVEAENKARRELLLRVYDAAINEIRFNVLLSWDRTKQFLILSSALVAAGVGLIKVAEGSAATSAFLVVYFVLSILITLCGVETIAIGKVHYHEAIFTKTLVERELGLLKLLPDLQDARANLSIAVTDGQRDYRNLLFGAVTSAGSASKIGPGTIVFQIRTIFWIIAGIDLIGAIIAIINFARAWSP